MRDALITVLWISACTLLATGACCAVLRVRRAARRASSWERELSEEDEASSLRAAQRDALAMKLLGLLTAGALVLPLVALGLFFAFGGIALYIARPG